MPVTTAPSGTATGTTVAVSWAAATFAGGPSVSGYVVRAYNATTDAPRAVGGTCVGTVSALTCNDTGVAAGGWKYTVQPQHGGWLGIESAQSAVVTVVTDTTDTTPPVPTAVTLVNAGTAGTAARGDQVVITVSEVLSMSSICPGGWSGTGDKTLSGNGEVIATITNSGTNDVLTLTSATCTGGLKFGSLALGGDYVSATRTFSGNGANSTRFSWSASAMTLTIQLGTASGSVETGVPLGTPTWTPSSSITDVAGNAMAATPFSATATSRL